jgi:hypothetical protein
MEDTPVMQGLESSLERVNRRLLRLERWRSSHLKHLESSPLSSTLSPWREEMIPSVSSREPQEVQPRERG